MKLLACHIENFGKLSNLSIDFNDGINVVRSRYTNEIFQAIRCVVNHQLPACPTGRAGREPVIEGEVCVLGKVYRVEVKQNSANSRLFLAAYDEVGEV